MQKYGKQLFLFILFKAMECLINKKLSTETQNGDKKKIF